MRFRLLGAIPFLLASASAGWASYPTDLTSAPLAEVERLASSGSAVAQTYLGLVNDVGEGVPQDPSTAARWYRLAAEQGNPDAQMFLGSAYLEGRGVHRDIGSALLWLDLAANTLRGEDRSTCEELLDQATWSASADQLARVQRLAAEWRPKPAEQPPVVPLAARSPARHRRYLATLSD